MSRRYSYVQLERINSVTLEIVEEFYGLCASTREMPLQVVTAH